MTHETGKKSLGISSLIKSFLPNKNAIKGKYSWSLLQKRNIEPEIVLLPIFLNENSIYIDVGSYKGIFIDEALTIVPPKNVYAFEPSPYLFHKLKNTFPSISLFDDAISDTDGTGYFNIPIINEIKKLDKGTLLQSVLGDYVNYMESIKVSISSLDSWAVSQQLTQIDFIRIDTEGNELHCIRGAKDIISAHHPILLVKLQESHYGKRIPEIIRPIVDLGYKAYFLHRKTKCLQEITKDFSSQYVFDSSKKNKMPHSILFLPSHISYPQIQA